MSNDILYRLREADAWFRSAGNIPESDPPTLLMEAIQEIQLQRSLNSSLAQCLEGTKHELEQLRSTIAAPESPLVEILRDECICYNAWGPDEFPCLECQARAEIERLLALVVDLRQQLDKPSA